MIGIPVNGSTLYVSSLPLQYHVRCTGTCHLTTYHWILPLFQSLQKPGPLGDHTGSVSNP